MAQKAHATGGSVQQQSVLTRKQLDEILRPEILIRPTPLNLALPAGGAARGRN